jgi:hypothetical protein
MIFNYSDSPKDDYRVDPSVPLEALLDLDT